MFGSSILRSLFANILETKFVKEVYHSVKLQQDVGGTLKPVAPVDSRFVYVGIDDRTGFTCYCRQTGPADVQNIEKLGGCSTKKYRLQIPHRLVFFNQEEKKDHDSIVGKLIAATIGTSFIKLQRVLTIPEDILRSEAPTGRFTFREHSFYVAIDFFVLLDTQPDNCETEITCDGTENPFCL